MSTLECLRCHGPMEAGFVLDYKHANERQVQNWVEGEPVKSFWTGLKIKGREQHKVLTYRCERCGFLESYANEHVI